MIKIKLTRGKFALIDEVDFERVSKHKWHSSKNSKGSGWYAMKSIGARPNRGKIAMHNFILGEMWLDHKNGDGLDNRRANLRKCDVSQNGANRKKQAGKTSSKYKGVSFNKRQGKWVAHIKNRKARHYLGVFKTEVEAARAYDDKAIDLFGEFAKLNLKRKK